MKKPILILLLTGLCISFMAQIETQPYNAHENCNKSDSLDHPGSGSIEKGCFCLWFKFQ